MYEKQKEEKRNRVGTSTETWAEIKKKETDLNGGSRKLGVSVLKHRPAQRTKVGVVVKKIVLVGLTGKARQTNYVTAEPSTSRRLGGTE